MNTKAAVVLQALVIVSIAAILAAGPAHASPIVDQSQPIIDTSVGGVVVGGYSHEKMAQVVTAGVSGFLTEVRFPIACSPSAATVTLELQGVVAGKPNDVVIASAVFAATSFPIFYPAPPVFRSMAFPTPAFLTAGTQYAITLYSTGDCGVFQGPVGDPYPGGNGYYNSVPPSPYGWGLLGSRFDLPFQTVVDVPPVSAGGPYYVDEGGSVVVQATVTSPLNGPLTFAWDLDNNGTFETPGQSAVFSAAGLDGPSVHTIAVKVTDAGGVTATSQAVVNVQNVAPSIGPISGPLAPVPVNTEISASAGFTDPGTQDTHTASWNWGDNAETAGTVSEVNGSGTVTDQHTYAAAGVYALRLLVVDKDGASAQAFFQYVVVYDPAAGFASGSGWFNSPTGAYPGDPSFTGKASFGFVSRYQTGQSVPDGQTQFSLDKAKLNFHSTSYDWLVIVGGPRAQYQGSGTIDGAGDYGFMLVAGDGGSGSGVDMIRMKIWDKLTGAVIYDNQPGASDDAMTVLGGGQITIHN